MSSIVISVMWGCHVIVVAGRQMTKWAVMRINNGANPFEKANHGRHPKEMDVVTNRRQMPIA